MPSGCKAHLAPNLIAHNHLECSLDQARVPRRAQARDGRILVRRRRRLTVHREDFFVLLLAAVPYARRVDTGLEVARDPSFVARLDESVEPLPVRGQRLCVIRVGQSRVGQSSEFDSVNIVGVVVVQTESSSEGLEEFATEGLQSLQDWFRLLPPRRDDGADSSRDLLPDCNSQIVRQRSDAMIWE